MCSDFLAFRYDAEKSEKEKKERKEKQLKRIEEARKKAAEPKGEDIRNCMWNLRVYFVVAQMTRPAKILGLLRSWSPA